MQLVGVHLVPTRDLRHTRAQRKALLDNPSLLTGRPPPPALATHQHRSRRHACSLICQLMSKPRTRDSPKPERGRSDAYFRNAARDVGVECWRLGWAFPAASQMQFSGKQLSAKCWRARRDSNPRPPDSKLGVVD